LKIELPKEIQVKKKTEANRQEQGEGEGQSAIQREPTLSRQPSLNKMPSLTRQKSQYFSYDDILTKVVNNMKIVSEKGLFVKASDKNWYKHANMVISELLTLHEIPEDLINKYIIFHFLDYLSISEKLLIVEKIYDRSDSEFTGYENIFKLYFDNLLLVNAEDERAVILSNGEANILYVNSGPREWRVAEYTEQESFKGSRKAKFNIPIERINKTEIGFMSLFKGKDMSFKIKDMSQKRNNKGAKCEDASKPVIAEKIGIVLNERGIYSGTEIEKPDLCIILEILMRWITEKNNIDGQSGIILFFGPEQANEMNITNLRIV